MIHNPEHWPDYVHKLDVLDPEANENLLAEISTLSFKFTSKGIGAKRDGYVGVYGDKFLDRPILVVHSGDTESKEINSWFFDKAKEIFYKFIENENIVSNEILRTRLNITFPSSDRRPTASHVDLFGEQKHYVFIYYFNSCDADTVLYKQKADGTHWEDSDLTELARFTPQAGAGLLFNGDYIHSWHHPYESDYRCSITMNIDVDFVDN